MKLQKDKWGAPIFGSPIQTTYKSPVASDFVDNVSGQGLLYPKQDRHTIGFQAQTTETAHDLINSAMFNAGYVPMPMGPA